jgi:phage replication O-like protein O
MVEARVSEKLKPNFTPVPNVVFDSIMRTLASGPLKVLLAVCRYTYGWGKQADRISLGQLAEMTNMNRSNVHRAAKQLGSLLFVKPGNPSKNEASEYRLNVEISDTDLLSLRQQEPLSTRQQPVVRPVVTSATIQRNPKKEEKNDAKASASVTHKRSGRLTRGAGIPPELQPTVSSIVAKINELAGTHYRDDKPDALRNLLDRLRDGQTEAECLTVVEGRHAAWAGNEKMLEYLRPSTLFAKKHFEDYLQDAQRRGNGNAEDPEYRKRTFINA